MILTYDVEDYNKNKETGEWEPVLDATGKNFLLGCIYKDSGKKKSFTKPKEMWEYILACGKAEMKRDKRLMCYAHNAKFDFYQIANIKDKNLRFFSESPFIASYYFPVEREFTRQKFESWKWYANREKIDYDIIVEMGNTVIIKYLKEGIKFLDSFAIYTMGLAKVGEIIELPKTQMPNKVGREMTKEKIKEIERYCLNDCIVTMKAIDLIKGKLEEEDINIRNLCTINQIGISYILNKLRKLDADQVLYRNKAGELTDWTHKSKNNDKIHSAYRGGYVRAWKTGVFENATSIDVTSLYPYSAINMRFPDLRTEKLMKEPLKIIDKEDLLKMIGISRVMIFNESNDLGLLQIRTPEKAYLPKKGKYMIGTWTHRELTEALKEGYKILGIEWSLIWEETENPLSKIYSELYEKRKNSGNRFDDWFYKAIMNSSLGKFGQRKTDQIMVIDSVEEIYKYLAKGYKIKRDIEGKKEIMFVKQDLEDGRPKKYYSPIIPALVNAYARVHMYKQYKLIPKENLLYTDTDSILHTGDFLNRFNMNGGLGEFKIEKDKDNGEELINKKAIIWGTKSKSIGNNIAVSGAFKSELTMEQFTQGKVKTRRMLGIKSLNEDRVGEFVEEERDLNDQQERFWKIEEIMELERLYVDHDIEDITYFKEELKRIL